LARVARLTGGSILLGAGVVLVVLPIVPGAPVVVLAVCMLAADLPFFARLLEWSRSRASRLVSGMRCHHERFRKDFERRFPVKS
jgi:uncharacterized membrane protein YbaN (DUF454 family)